MGEASHQRFGIVGLGKMGSSIALRALHMKMGVAGFDKAGAPIELVQAGLIDARNLERLAEALDPPRITMPYVPAGRLVDDLLDALAEGFSGEHRRREAFLGNAPEGPRPPRWLAAFRTLYRCGRAATPIGATPFAATRASPAGAFILSMSALRGPDGELNGACSMVGGDEDPVLGARLGHSLLVARSHGANISRGRRSLEGPALC